MSATTKILCDRCGKDISEEGDHPSYRLVLSAEKLPNNSNVTLDVIAYPPIDHARHFCCLACLKAWTHNLP